MTDSHSPTPRSGPEKIESSTARDKPRSREANSASLVNSKNHEPASNLRAHETAVLIWNRFYPVGTPVLVKRDDGSVTPSETISGAELLGGHTAVVWLRDIRGAYLLDRVSPRVGA